MMSLRRLPYGGYAMAKARTLIYADSCVFTAYFNDEPGRASVCDSVFSEIVKSSTHRLVTSVHSLVEVAYLQAERKNRQLQPKALEKIDLLWANSALLEIVEYSEHIARQARELMRLGIASNRSLKPSDAIHLATAKFVNAERLFTYDTQLSSYSAWTGVPSSEPVPVQHRMDL